LVVVALVAPVTATAQRQKIKVTLPAAAVTFASCYHAKTAGDFADEGLDAEIVTVAPATYQIEAYQKG